jgi:2-oxoglutarate ferredoxin oxidoreductase subunit alpha
MSVSKDESQVPLERGPAQPLESVAIRFAGDSGDGMQLTGSRFTLESAFLGNDLSTLPDFPAEIRAPAGSLPGVSAFQIRIGGIRIFTAVVGPQNLAQSLMLVQAPGYR